MQRERGGEGGGGGGGRGGGEMGGERGGGMIEFMLTIALCYSIHVDDSRRGGGGREGRGEGGREGETWLSGDQQMSQMAPAGLGFRV
jgi:hypothetical protein